MYSKIRPSTTNKAPSPQMYNRNNNYPSNPLPPGFAPSHAIGIPSGVPFKVGQTPYHAEAVGASSIAKGSGMTYGVAPIKQHENQDPGTEREMSPRGKHYYPPMTPWTCTGIVTWINFGLVVFLAVMVIILYANWRGGPLTSPTVIAKLETDLKLLKDRLEEESKEQIELGVRRKRPKGHNHTQYVDFELKGKTGTFVRWPSTGIIENFDFKNLIGMRLCCHAGTSDREYFVCDAGQGASDNLALECIVFNIEKEGGAHLTVYVQSENMNGARCTFTWKTRHHNVEGVTAK